jgi:hypothetical protein
MVPQFDNTSASAIIVVFGVDTRREGYFPIQQSQVKAEFTDQTGTFFTDRVGAGRVCFEERARLVNLYLQ